MRPPGCAASNGPDQAGAARHRQWLHIRHLGFLAAACVYLVSAQPAFAQHHGGGRGGHGGGWYGGGAAIGGAIA